MFDILAHSPLTSESDVLMVCYTHIYIAQYQYIYISHCDDLFLVGCSICLLLLVCAFCVQAHTVIVCNGMKKAL